MIANHVTDFPHGADNDRNSEGSFVTLRDGRIFFLYTRYRGAGGEDSDMADLAGIFSADGGITWSDPRIVIHNDGRWNIMSVSLLRLKDGRIALVYLQKNEMDDWRPLFRISFDECATWNPARPIMQRLNRFVVNNDRIIQLQNGRILVPVAQHATTRLMSEPERRISMMRASFIMVWSDDGGATWQEGDEQWAIPSGRGYLQEPGVIELADGRLWCFMRTNIGRQWESFSSDRGATWTVPGPSRFYSPRSPLSMKRNPATGELLAVWNDAALAVEIWGESKRLGPDGNGPRGDLSWGRTPLVAAISRDEGKTWGRPVILESEPDHGYCYTAIHFAGENVLLAYCCGGGATSHVLQDLRIRCFPWRELAT